jgi:iron(III) transport system substrate-binding protein
MVLDVAPNPNAAQVLADFLVSPEGQAATVKDQKDQVAILPDIPDSPIPYADVRRSEPIPADDVRAFHDAWKAAYRN